jgi:ribosome-associated toxin RatA of RatAB toxin-antitoxin module
MFLQLSFLFFVILTGISEPTETDWKLESDKEGIRIHTRFSGKSDFKEFKGEVVVDAPISTIAQLIADVERYPEWCYKTSLVTIIEKDSTTTRYFYVSETPAFLKKRVGFFETRRNENPQTGEITFSLRNYKSSTPLSGDMLLIPIMDGYWKLTPLSNGKVHLTMQMLTEPGGIIPAWLANLVVVDSPYVTLKNLSLLLKSSSNNKK